MYRVALLPTGLLLAVVGLAGCGASERPVIPEDATHIAPCVVNGKIAFVSRRWGNDEIHVMNLDGSGETRLTHDPDKDQYPDWSPDGSKIVWCRYEAGGWSLRTMRAMAPISG